jgi:ring-1,2-phenylacetyl-CoA epoxidase subunit PaaB
MASSASVGVGYDEKDKPDTAQASQWPLWEVFTQEDGGAPHEHAGSVHAADAEMALQNARDVYGRRGKVVSMWVVPSNVITASQSEWAGPFFDPGADKVYRHPQFYKIPRGLKGF